jgi:Rieske [2Fe-2S] domain
LGRLIQGFLLLLISETHAGPLRTWLDNFRPSSLFILDEAHHAAPSSGGPLSEGDVQGTRVTCPWHGADFDLKTGAVLGICYKQVQAPATHYITFNGHSVERTSRRAHGSVLSALPTLGEPGMGPNVVQEPFLRCASQSFKRRRKRLVAWILHLSATDPLLATYSPKRSRPRCRRLALETDHIPAKFFDPIRYRRRHKNACTYSGTF